MGSPLTFWKLQQVPMLWVLDRLGYGSWIDDPIEPSRRTLALARLTALWIWLVALALVAYWSRRLYGPRAMVLAAWLFALSPNLLAHGPLITMETPIVAAMTGMALPRSGSSSGPETAARSGQRPSLGGLALSCKFTAVVSPPISGSSGGSTVAGAGTAGRPAWSCVATGMLGFLAIMLLADVVITGCAMLPIERADGGPPQLRRQVRADRADAGSGELPRRRSPRTGSASPPGPPCNVAARRATSSANCGRPAGGITTSSHSR